MYQFSFQEAAARNNLQPTNLDFTPPSPHHQSSVKRVKSVECKKTQVSVSQDPRALLLLSTVPHQYTAWQWWPGAMVPMVTTHPDLILIPRLTAPRRCQHFDPATTGWSQGVIAGIQVIHHICSIDCAQLRLSSLQSAPVWSHTYHR